MSCFFLLEIITFKVSLCLSKYNGSKQWNQTTNCKSVCMRGIFSQNSLDHTLYQHHHCKYVNILYVCGNVLTCHSLAIFFFWFNPSKCHTHTYHILWKHLETIEMDWHGFVLKFGSKTNPICLHLFVVPMCVYCFKSPCTKPRFCEWHKNKNKRTEKKRTK